MAQILPFDDVTIHGGNTLRFHTGGVNMQSATALSAYVENATGEDGRGAQILRASVTVGDTTYRGSSPNMPIAAVRRVQLQGPNMDVMIN